MTETVQVLSKLRTFAILPTQPYD